MYHMLKEDCYFTSYPSIHSQHHTVREIDKAASVFLEIYCMSQQYLVKGIVWIILSMVEALIHSQCIT